MEIFPWNKNFETGVPQVDEQHKTLVGLVNRLASSLSKFPDKAVLGPVFDELATYADYHFQVEEAFWHQFLPDDEWEQRHKADHEGFVVRVHQMRQEAKNLPPGTMVRNVLLYLTRWLAFHILENDRRMATVARAIQSGATPEQAKQQVDLAMNGAFRELIESVLSLSEILADRTLELMAENLERKKAEDKLRLVDMAFHNAQEATCITDSDTRIINANPMFCQSVGLAEGELIGRELKALKSGMGDNEQADNPWLKVREQGYWRGDILNRNANGEIGSEWLNLSSIRDEQGVITNYVASFFNISHLTSRLQTLQRMAHRDALTSLPNRVLLADRLEHAMAEINRSRDYLAICFLDLDGFKAVNDQLGHAAGDKVLQEVARRIQHSLRRNDTVARLGGDEFVLLLGHLKEPEDCQATLGRLLTQIGLPVTVSGHDIEISASIGVTIFPTDNTDAEGLLQHADEAMYQAKRLGKSRYFIYERITQDG